MNSTAINLMSYPDFVATLGQTNTPPGGASTLAQWSEWVPMGAEREQQVLDLACSTGYSGRTWVSLRDDVKCIDGIDISLSAIEKATQLSTNKSKVQYTYNVADAASLPYDDNSFDVVLGGCNFAFIADRFQALKEVARVLRPGGRLVVADFFYRYTPQNSLLDKLENSVGFRPDAAWTRNFWNDFYGQHLIKEAEIVESLEPVPTSIMAAACVSSVRNVESLRSVEKIYAFRRLFNTRKLLNSQRSIQGVSLQCWRLP